MVLLEKANGLYNGILMENVWISVMDLLDFCCIFFSRDVYIGFRLKKETGKLHECTEHTLYKSISND